MNLTQKANEIISNFLANCTSPIALDLTAGNGFDTLSLAKNVGEFGKVFAFDIQAQAIESSKNLLEKNHLTQRCVFINDSHEFLKKYLPQEFIGKVNVAMFNLGWLPKSDKRTITKPESTLAALSSLEELVDKNQNIITVLSYRAHDGGEDEFLAVANYLKKFNPQIFCDENNPKSPVLFVFKM